MLPHIYYANAWKPTKVQCNILLLLANTREIMTEVFTLVPKSAFGAYRYGTYGSILPPIPGFAWYLFFF